MPRALKPVQDVSAAGVVNLIKGVWIRLLHGHRVAGGTEKEGISVSPFDIMIQESKDKGTTFFYINDKIPTKEQRKAKLSLFAIPYQLFREFPHFYKFLFEPEPQKTNANDILKRQRLMF